MVRIIDCPDMTSIVYPVDVKEEIKQSIDFEI